MHVNPNEPALQTAAYATAYATPAIQSLKNLPQSQLNIAMSSFLSSSASKLRQQNIPTEFSNKAGIVKLLRYIHLCLSSESKISSAINQAVDKRLRILNKRMGQSVGWGLALCCTVLCCIPYNASPELMTGIIAGSIALFVATVLITCIICCKERSLIKRLRKPFSAEEKQQLSQATGIPVATAQPYAVYATQVPPSDRSMFAQQANIPTATAVVAEPGKQE